MIPRPPSVLITMLVIAGAGGCMRQPELKLATASSEQPRPLWELHFDGNHRFSEAEIRAKLASEVTDYHTVRFYDGDMWSDDTRRIVALYKEHGYYSTRVTDVRYFEWEGRQLVVQARIDEGPVTRVRALSVNGAPPGIRTDLALSEGDAFEHPRYLESKDRLRRRLRLAGYPHAEVTGEIVVDPGSLGADIVIDIKPGPLSEFGAVSIGAPTGDSSLGASEARVVRSLLTFKQGRRYSEEELEESRNRLYETGAFEQVDVDPDLSEGGPVVPVGIKVTMGRPRQLRLGVGIGSETNQQEVRTSASWLHRNFKGGLNSLELFARVGYAWLPSVVSADVHGVVAETGIRAIEPARTRALLDFSQGLTLDTQLVDEYRSYGVKPELGVARRWVRFRRKITLGMAYKAEARAFTFLRAVPAAVALENGIGVDDRFLLSYLEPQIIYDTRNDPLDASRGLYLALTTDHSVGGTYAFDRFVPEARVYFPLLGTAGRLLTVTARARVGLISPRYEDESIHVSQRFFAGGSSSHRGFGFRRMSPRCYIPDADPTQCVTTPTGPSEIFLIGGQTLLESSLELRSMPWQFPIGGTPAGLGGVIFLDAGRVGAPDDRASDFTLEKLELAIGWGIRFDTIVAPVRIDFGYRVGDKDKNGLGSEESVVWHFTLGQAF